MSITFYSGVLNNSIKSSELADVFRASCQSVAV